MSTSFSLAELAERVGGRVVGNDTVRVSSVRALADAGPDDLSFLHNGGYREAAVASPAAALLLPETLEELIPELARPVIVVGSSQLALARILELLFPEPRPEPGIHPTAVIGERCHIDPSASIGPYAVIGDDVEIGRGSIIEAHVAVGSSCRIGEDCRIRPSVVLYHGCELGDRVQVHSGTVLGADGFGYASVGGVHHKVPQVGRVVIGTDVEVGANSAVDRALLEATRIGDGSKIDNLVQVGHNVQTGKGCLLCGQAGIGGSSELGDYVVLGGQAGVADHIDVGHGAQVAAKAAVYGRLESGIQAGGVPAVELRSFRRQSAALARLPDLLKRVRSLEKKLEKLASDD